MLFKRIKLGGIGLAIVLLAFVALPMLWLRNVDHPLTASTAVDVCAYFTDTVLATLPQPPQTVARGVPGESDTGKPACQVVLPSSTGAAGAPGLWVMVTTERMLNTGGRPLRTDRFVDNWLKESGASGSEVTPVKGPWRGAAVIQDSMRPGKTSLLADDAGVIVWVNAQGIDTSVLVAFSEAITRSLRGKPLAATAR